MSHSLFNFPKKLHLRAKRDFDAVFDTRKRRARGPLAIHSRPNGLDFSRVGITIPKKVGKAVLRNRIRRLLREVFRLSQSELPVGHDWVFLVRPHEPLQLTQYQALVKELIA